jgi:hypothetical protein
LREACKLSAADCTLPTRTARRCTLACTAMHRQGCMQLHIGMHGTAQFCTLAWAGPQAWRLACTAQHILSANYHVHLDAESCIRVKLRGGGGPCAKDCWHGACGVCVKIFAEMLPYNYLLCQAFMRISVRYFSRKTGGSCLETRRQMRRIWQVSLAVGWLGRSGLRPGGRPVAASGGKALTAGN